MDFRAECPGSQIIGTVKVGEGKAMRGNCGIDERIEFERPCRLKFASHPGSDHRRQDVRGLRRANERFTERRFQCPGGIHNLVAAVGRVVAGLRCIAGRSEEDGTMRRTVDAMEANARFDAPESDRCH